MPRLNALNALSLVLCGTATSDAQIISDLMALSETNQGTTDPSPVRLLPTPDAAPQGNNGTTTFPLSQTCSMYTTLDSCPSRCSWVGTGCVEVISTYTKVSGYDCVYNDVEEIRPRPTNVNDCAVRCNANPDCFSFRADYSEKYNGCYLKSVRRGCESPDPRGDMYFKPVPCKRDVRPECTQLSCHANGPFCESTCRYDGCTAYCETYPCPTGYVHKNNRSLLLRESECCEACGTDGANWRGFFGNEDLFGQPLTNIDSSCTCKTQCSESFDCEFWSYQKEARLCWLRKNFKSVQEDRSYVSGWRETPLCSNVAGGTSSYYPCTCGQTGRSGVKCQKGELCTATSDGGGVCQARLQWIVTDDFGTSCDRACEKKGLYCSETDWFGSDLNSAKVAFQAAGVPCSKGIRTAQDEQDLPISWKSDSRPCRIGKSSTCGATSAWQKWEDQVNTRRLCPCLQACKTASDCPSGYACFKREKGVRGECQAPGQNCRERGSKTECEDDQICHWCLPPKKMGTCMDKDKQCPVHISDNGSFTMPVISSPIEI